MIHSPIGKSPWHKWIAFIAAALQTITLSLEIRDFREVSRTGIRDKLFSPTGWESYVAEQYFHFAISISLICMFFGIFFIGLFARSKKAAGISEGILLLSIGLLLGIVGVVLPVFSDQANTILWLFLLIILFCGGIWSLWKNRR